MPRVKKPVVRIGDTIRITKKHTCRAFHGQEFKVIYVFMRQGKTYACFKGGGAYETSFKKVTTP